MFTVTQNSVTEVTEVGRQWTYTATLPAVLHVDVAVVVVPHTFNTQEAGRVGSIAHPGQRVDEKVLLDPTISR